MKSFDRELETKERDSSVAIFQGKTANASPANSRTPDDHLPYLGLRPFEPEDKKFFWGRQTHVDDLCERLSKRNFVAVVGLSGAGKSSLVRAGLIPELTAGRLRKASSDWLIAVMNPENSPVTRLSDALIHSAQEYANDPDNEYELPRPRNIPLPAPHDKEENLVTWEDDLRKQLKAGDDGLRVAISNLRLPKSAQILIVVDQFEELFRFDQSSRSARRQKKDEGQEFVQKLITAADPKGRIYVITTMRSEFMGDCAAYAGLAETVNNGMYLTPRLTIEQLKSAICSPAQLENQIIEPDLVARLVNDVANDPDQLPVLQHALMRSWVKRKPDQKLDLALYESDEVGGKNALDVHANLILELITKSERGAVRARVVEKLFKRITKMGSKEGLRDAKDAGVRDAASLSEICYQIDESPDDVKAVIDAFREPRRAFLRPPIDEKLTPDSIIDITHESLIRKWKLLKDWVVEEENAASDYRVLAAAEESYAKRVSETKSTSGVLPVGLTADQIPQFTRYLDKPWTAQWAERYGGKFEQIESFLEKSARYHKREAEIRWRLLRNASVAGGIAVVFVASLAIAYGNSTKEQVLAMLHFTKIAANRSWPMGERVPAAVSALSIELNKKINREVAEEISLDNWELFAALRKPTAGDLNPKPKPANDNEINAGGVSVSPNGKLAAIVDGNVVRVWDGRTTPRATASFTGADKVRLDPSGTRLVVASKPVAGSVNIQIFDIKTSAIEPFQKSMAVKFDSADDGIAMLTFVGESEGKNAKSDGIMIVTRKGQIFSSRPSREPNLKSSPTMEKDSDRGSPSDIIIPAIDARSRYLLLAYSDGSVSVMDLASKALKTHLPINSRVTAAAFSDDGECVIVATADYMINTSKNPFGRSACMTSPPAYAYTPSKGDYIISVAMTHKTKENPNGEEWTIAAGTLANTAFTYGSDSYSSPPLLHQGPVRGVSFTSSGQLVTASEDQKARLFDPVAGQELMRVAHVRPVVFAVKAADQLISAGTDGTLVWTSLSGGPIVPRSHYNLSKTQSTCNLGSAVAASADQIAIAACDGSILVGPYSAAKTLASRSGEAPVDPWDSRQLSLVRDGLASDKPASDGKEKKESNPSSPMIAFSANSETLAWADFRPINDGKQKSQVHIRTQVNHALLRDSQEFPSAAQIGGMISVSKKGLRLATAIPVLNGNWAIRVYAISGGKFAGAPQIYDLPATVNSKSLAVTALAVADDGNVAAGTSDGQIFWIAGNPGSFKIPGGGSSPRGRANAQITALSFAAAKEPGAKLLIVGNSDKKIFVHNISASQKFEAKGQLLSRDTQSSFLALSPDSKWLAAVAGPQVKLFSRDDAYLSSAEDPSRRSPYRFQSFLNELDTSPLVVQALTFSGSDSTSAGAAEFPKITTIALLNRAGGDYVSPQPTLVTFEHGLSILAHAKSICDNLPPGNNEFPEWIRQNWATRTRHLNPSLSNAWFFTASQNVCENVRSEADNQLSKK